MNQAQPYRNLPQPDVSGRNPARSGARLPRFEIALVAAAILLPLIVVGWRLVSRRATDQAAIASQPPLSANPKASEISKPADVGSARTTSPAPEEAGATRAADSPQTERVPLVQNPQVAKAADDAQQRRPAADAKAAPGPTPIVFDTPDPNFKRVVSPVVLAKSQMWANRTRSMYERAAATAKQRSPNAAGQKGEAGRTAVPAGETPTTASRGP
jgi:hypothetical protein